jgi:hypothetical protein
MSSPDRAAIIDLLTHGPYRSDVGRKQLTLAFGGLYIASTTASAKPQLVWETEKGYPRYYIPTASLHADIKRYLTWHKYVEDKTNGYKASGLPVEVAVIGSLKGKNNDSLAIIERVTVGSKSSTWVRFVEGPLKGLIRFERSEIGRPTLHDEFQTTVMVSASE